MCILFMAIGVNPDYPLIICANRDEFHHRPTEPAHFWPPEQNLLAGKDLLAGGTWLGLNRSGSIAALTNIRSPADHSDNRRSRGELIPKYLSGDDAFVPWLEKQAPSYNPFNLVFGSGQTFYCFNSLQRSLEQLSPGCHAISNGAMDDVWPKMAKGQQALEALVSAPGMPDEALLLEMMRDESRPEDTRLPQTGVSLEWERRLSSIYIRHDEYGTRSTSLLLQDTRGHISFTEVRYDGKGRNLGSQRFKLRTASQ